MHACELPWAVFGPQMGAVSVHACELPSAVSPPLQVAAGSVQKAVIVETKKEFQRADGSCMRFDRNACVLVNAKGLPIGTRVLGFVTHELRARQLMKVPQAACCCRVPRLRWALHFWDGHSQQNTSLLA